MECNTCKQGSRLESMVTPRRQKNACVCITGVWGGCLPDALNLFVSALPADPPPHPTPPHPSPPQMIFLNSLFGYLCIAIIYKWLSAKMTDLYHVMIYMFLSPGRGRGGRTGVMGLGG